MNAKAEDLYQYGVMGSIYAETILGVSEPKIGLLNVGTEDDKGTDLTKSTARSTRRARWLTGSSATSKAATSTKGTPAWSSARGLSATCC